MSGEGENDASQTKRMKYSDGEGSRVLKDFSVTKILKEDSKVKLMAIHGKFEGANDDAVLLLEKLPFASKTVNAMLTGSNLHETLKNDIYSTYEAVSPPSFPGYKTTMIYPATEKHIAKYSEQDVFVVHETKELYSMVTKPSLEQSSFSLQWVYNILEKKTESERIIHEDVDPETGFILLPDMKWDRKDVNSLYLVAIVNKHGVKSLRDLNKQCLPLLKNILNTGTKVIKEKFNIPDSKLRIYIHYQPSYYHLHVHFTHVKFDAPGSDVFRAHLLSSVIENIENNGDFYENKTLSFTLRENDNLFKKYNERGYFD
ncbi:hypothetical protein SNE40_016956 [Patella caerulea]|uniref:m7GpppX diphosphatase n=1 Tax=Patella caerulea TaxID=87958 RepID=A0AAN8JE29_PATCE